MKSKIKSYHDEATYFDDKKCLRQAHTCLAVTMTDSVLKKDKIVSYKLLEQLLTALVFKII